MMWDNIVGLHIKRCNRNLLLVNAIIQAGLLTLGFANYRYLVNCFRGPFPISHEALDRIVDPTHDAHYYVSIDNLSVVETGLQSLQKTVDKYTGEVKNQTITATFFVAKDSRPLIIKSPSESRATQYTGALVAVPPDVRDYFQRTFLDEKHPFEEVFAPFMLDATEFRGDAYIGLCLCIPVGLLAAWNIKKAVARIRNAQTSPIYKSLDHYGQPPEFVAQAIDEEFKTHNECSPISAVNLLPSWLLHRTFFHFTVMQINEIIWIHEKVTTHSVNFIPTGKTYAIVIHDATGRTIEVNGRRSKEKISSLVTVLQARIPWAVFGY
ncbi:MAG TPA: DUF6709 family protein, partial [Blastocatellia bacterium]